MELHLQCANGSIGVQIGHQTSVSHQVVDATLDKDLSRVGSGLLQGVVLGKVCMEDVDIVTVTKLCHYLLLGGSFVADQTDNQVFLVFRDLPKELELDGN